MTGNIFRGHELDSFFNLVGVLTGQGIQLLGMSTEAIHTPLLQDLFLSIKSALYVQRGPRSQRAVRLARGQPCSPLAGHNLREAVESLREIDHLGLFKGLESSLFANIKRSPAGGRGLDGVIERDATYFNPFYEALLS